MTLEDIAACLAALSTKHLDILTVNAVRCSMVDTTAIVAWLRGQNTSCFSLSCDSVRDPMALASAIESSSTLRTLGLEDVLDVQEDLVAIPKSLHHITVLVGRVLARRSDLVLDLLQKLDRTEVYSVSVVLNFKLDEGDQDQELPATTILNDLASYSTFKSLCLMTALGACHNVTLHVDEDELTPDTRKLVDLHHLVESSPGVFTSSSRASSPWHVL